MQRTYGPDTGGSSSERLQVATVARRGPADARQQKQRHDCRGDSRVTCRPRAISLGSLGADMMPLGVSDIARCRRYFPLQAISIPDVCAPTLASNLKQLLPRQVLNRAFESARQAQAYHPRQNDERSSCNIVCARCARSISVNISVNIYITRCQRYCKG